MKKKIILSIAVALLVNGCSTQPQTQKFKDNNTTVEIVASKLDTTKVDRKFVAIKKGDTAEKIFEKISQFTGNTYILQNNESKKFTSLIDVERVEIDEDSIKNFFDANNYSFFQYGQNKYKKVHISKIKTKEERELKDTNIKASGLNSAKQLLSTIAIETGLNINYLDKEASEQSDVLRDFDFSSNALESLENIAKISEINIIIDETNLNVSSLQTKSFKINVFGRDRQLSNTISNIPSATDTANSSSGSSNETQATSSASSSSDLKSSFISTIIKELRVSLDSTISKKGSYSLLPTTGQVIVRDKTENLNNVEQIINNFNASFKDTFEMKITFFKVAVSSAKSSGIDFSGFNKNWNLSATNMATSVVPGGVAKGAYALGFSNDSGSRTALLKFLQEKGETTIENTINFETQANIPKSIKIANNYNYISSISSTTGTTGIASGSVEQSTVPDGTFFNILTKSIDSNFIAADVYATTNTLNRFNTSTVFGNTVQTPDTSEQSVDGYHQLQRGVPYILVAHKYNEQKNNSNGLPIKYLDEAGLSEKSDKEIYIVITIEAEVK